MHVLSDETADDAKRIRFFNGAMTYFMHFIATAGDQSVTLFSNVETGQMGAFSDYGPVSAQAYLSGDNYRDDATSPLQNSRSDPGVVAVGVHPPGHDRQE